VIISADVAISLNPHEIRAWREAGHPIFFLKHACAHQSRWEAASRLFHLFPEILKLAEKAKRGDVFFVPFKGKIERPAN
jgi:hypothetical protein